MGSHSFENAEIRHRHDWGFILFNSKIKVGLGFSSIENSEIRYCWCFVLLKMLK